MTWTTLDRNREVLRQVQAADFGGLPAIRGAGGYRAGLGTLAGRHTAWSRISSTGLLNKLDNELGDFNEKLDRALMQPRRSRIALDA